MRWSRCWVRVGTGLVVTLALTACGYGTRLYKPEPPPAELLALCPDLPQAIGSALPLLWANHEQIKHAYAQCQQRHARLVQAVLRIDPKAN